MPHITTDEHHGEPIRLHYEDHGAGKPVVLIHGWPLSLRSWENQIPALVEAGHRVVAYDRRGFGESSQPWDGYDYETFAKDLDTLLTQLDLRDVTLVGFSMGGGEVALYVKTYGTGRVSKAVFAAAVPPYLYKSADNPDGGLDDATIEQFQSGIRGDRIAFVDQFLRDFFATGERTDLVSEAQRANALQTASFASPKGTLDCVAAFARTDFRGDLEGLRRSHAGDPWRLGQDRALRGQRTAYA
jgi:pimeloyl-ACP methyl ester carboxylesterase